MSKQEGFKLKEYKPSYHHILNDKQKHLHLVSPIKLQRYRTFQRSKSTFKTCRDQYFVVHLHVGSFLNARLFATLWHLLYYRVFVPTPLRGQELCTQMGFFCSDNFDRPIRSS